MMTIDEAIAHEREVAKDKRADADWKWRHGRLNADDCISCAEEHEQYAAWLKELSRRRVEELFRKNNEREMRNKFIDEFYNELCKEFVTEPEIKIICYRVAEQLKAGGESE